MLQKQNSMKQLVLVKLALLLIVTATAQSAKKKSVTKTAKVPAKNTAKATEKKAIPKIPPAITEIALGDVNEKVYGELFNSYKGGEGSSAYFTDSYQYSEGGMLIITDVNYEMEGDKKAATSISRFVVPKAKLDKKNSYVLNMEDDDATSKTWRLTLLSTNADSKAFEVETKYPGDESYGKKKVSFYTINFATKADGENVKTKLLK
jgi:hypothetical protein